MPRRSGGSACLLPGGGLGRAAAPSADVRGRPVPPAGSATDPPAMRGGRPRGRPPSPVSVTASSRNTQQSPSPTRSSAVSSRRIWIIARPSLHGASAHARPAAEGPRLTHVRRTPTSRRTPVHTQYSNSRPVPPPSPRAPSARTREQARGRRRAGRPLSRPAASSAPSTTSDASVRSSTCAVVRVSLLRPWGGGTACCWSCPGPSAAVPPADGPVDWVRGPRRSLRKRLHFYCRARSPARCPVVRVHMPQNLEASMLLWRNAAGDRSPPLRAHAA